MNRTTKLKRVTEIKQLKKNQHYLFDSGEYQEIFRIVEDIELDTEYNIILIDATIISTNNPYSKIEPNNYIFYTMKVTNNDKVKILDDKDETFYQVKYKNNIKGEGYES